MSIERTVAYLISTLSQKISDNHPVFGDEYRKLDDDDIISLNDQTACVSCLLSLSGDKWVDVTEKWFSDGIGKTVAWYRNNSIDGDRSERVFRRRRS